jgi:hypothetical protein
MKRKQTVLITSGMILAFLWTGHLLMGAWGIEIHRCEGDSMQPTLGDSAVYIVRKNPQEIHIGDIVTARVQIEGAITRVIKRVGELNNQRVFLRGDNSAPTWRGWVSVAAVEGKVVSVLWWGRVKQPPPVTPDEQMFMTSPDQPVNLEGWQRKRMPALVP